MAEGIVAALLAAQEKFERIPMAAQGQVGPRKYHYADLPAVLSAVTPALHAQGLVIVQRFEQTDAGQCFVTELHHKSGETIRSELLAPVSDMGAQDMGKWITYARRYSLCALLSVVGEEDTDGAGAEGVRGPRGAGSAPTSRDSGVQPPPRSTGGAFDEPIGFGKHGAKTWRQMTEGSQGGERHQYLGWLVDNARKPEIKERAQKCLDMMDARFEQEYRERENEATAQPEVGDASGF